MAEVEHALEMEGVEGNEDLTEELKDIKAAMGAGVNSANEKEEAMVWGEDGWEEALQEDTPDEATAEYVAMRG